MVTTYSEAIAAALKGRLVEIYLGDTYEQVAYADNSKNTSAVLIGRIVSAEGDCIVLDSLYKDHHDKKIKHGNVIYVNGNMVSAVCEVNGSGTLKDAISSSDSTADHVKV